MKTQNDFSELLFPKRLVLRFDSKGRRKNWHTYRSAVETFLRLKGLEGHLQTDSMPSFDLSEETERKKWGADDKLCVSVITLNIKGELPAWLGRMFQEGRSAGSLWKELGARGPLPTRELGGLRSEKDDFFMKVIISVSLASVIAVGMIAVIKAPPSAFESPRHRERLY
ncbi:hypothetical protein BC628DRAFT_39510 [Trametes gibbosa]|nr:hypothetical protein BC628DRAFT_39510 [Trametes gibbosa]